MGLFSRSVVQLPKLTTPAAADLAAKSNAAPASQALVKPGMSSSEYIHALEENKQSVDAVKALAHGMPEKDSVCWACHSSQQVADKLNPQEKAAAQAAQAWVKNPTEANQAAAAAAASKTDFKGPGGWAAQAAAWAKTPAQTPTAPTAGSVAGMAPAAAGSLAGKVPAAGNVAGMASTASSVASVASAPSASNVAGLAPTVAGLAGKAPAAANVAGLGTTPAAPAAPNLTAAAVTGAVMLAAGLVTGKPMSAPQKPNLESLPSEVPKSNIPSTLPTEPPPVDQSKMAKSLQPFIDNGKKISNGQLDCQKGLA